MAKGAGSLWHHIGQHWSISWGMQGLDIPHVHLFFSFTYNDIEYPCALVDWYDHAADKLANDMNMWIVKPIADSSAVIHLDTIMHCAHLIPVFGHDYVDQQLTLYDSLDAFLSYYVNKYADHHMHEIVFWSLLLPSIPSSQLDLNFALLFDLWLYLTWPCLTFLDI